MFSAVLLQIVAADTYNQTEIVKRLELSSGVSTFKSCLFHDITEPNEQGGAIYAYNSGEASFSIFLYDCSFSNCICEASHGGAIFCNINNFNATNTCFMQCCAEDGYGQAVYAELQENSNGIFLRTSIISCPKSSETGSSAPLALYTGRFDFDDSNNSCNHISDTFSAIYFESPSYCEASYCGITNNTGDVTLGESGVDRTIVFDHLNILYNHMKDDSSNEYGLFFMDSINKGTITKTVFIGNCKCLIHSPTEDMIKVTIQSCDFDLAQNEIIYDHSHVTIDFDQNCRFGKEREINPILEFDSRFCWMINPPKLAASSATYAFIIFFGLFAGIVGYALFIQFRNLSGTGPNNDYENI